MCKVCKGGCKRENEGLPPDLMECPNCDGAGCSQCSESGAIELTTCPKKELAPRFVRAINLASICGKGDWPVAGGMLDQAAWFLAVYERLKADVGKIQREQVENVTRRTN